MAIVFLLGPSEWDPGRGGAPSPPPMALRHAAAMELRQRGHSVMLMEQVADRSDEDLVDKFDRILKEDRVSDIIVIWPKGAKMQTTYDEMILLRDRAEEELPRIWVLHHMDVAEIRRGMFRVKEPGGRSRYLDAVARLGVHPLPWATNSDLERLVRRLARELV